MSEKSDRVACAVRAAIVRGDFTDGEHLSQSKLSREYGVHRDVISHALYSLEYEGFVSANIQHRYHVNASYLARQLQRVLTKLDYIESLCTQTVLALKRSPVNHAQDAWVRDRESREARRIIRAVPNTGPLEENGINKHRMTSARMRTREAP